MATTTSQSGHDRFSRIGLKFGQKSQQDLPGRAPAANRGFVGDEEWFIPYTGPYEPPPKPRFVKNNRDSWGDPILDLNSAQLFEAASNPQVHYDDDYSSGGGDPHDHRSSEESKTRGRARSHSVTSALTASTGVDHGRTSYSTHRPSNVSSFHRPPATISTYVNVGGVGESPVPVPRPQKNRPLSHRASLGSLFSTFGIKSPSGPGFTNRRMRSPSRKLSFKSSSSNVNYGVEASSNRVMSTNYHHHHHHHRRTASGDSHNHHHFIHKRDASREQQQQQQPQPLQSVDSHMTTAEDYYNSYYSTLIQSPVKLRPSTPVHHPHFLPSADSPPFQSDPSSSSSSSQHPYALVFPSKAKDLTQGNPPPPHSAPPFTGMHHNQSHNNHHPPTIPKLTFSESDTPLPRSNYPHFHVGAAAAAAGAVASSSSSGGTPRRDLKGSVSTPNLMSPGNNNNNNNNRSGAAASRPLPKGIDKWLSAETWCDALLFPRPRLKIKNDSSPPGGGGSGRSVSPPASPVLPSTSGGGGPAVIDSVPSRVLAHSRSLASLREQRREEASRQQQQGKSQGSGGGLSHPLPSSSQAQSRVVVGESSASGHLRPPRPRSWAQDDLDLPSPVPSLIKVLEDGERLESDRKDWQNVAFNSLGNKHARNVSRSRSKSLTAKGRKGTHQTQSNMNFLAARAVVGDQTAIPILPPTSKSSSHKGTTVSRSSHSRTASSNAQTQTNTSSMAQSLILSSRSHSRDHSRNDSWSKSAFKAVKSTAAPCCNNNNATISPTEEKKESEITPQKTEMKAIRIAADPPPIFSLDHHNHNHNHHPSSALSPPIGPSPTPSGLSSSGVSDPRVGIAISTPLTDESAATNENIRLPSHPYAQGGLYSYSEPQPPLPSHHYHHHEKRAKYAGPHPVQTIRATTEVPDGPVSRHKLPPHVTLSSHPYAQQQQQARPNRDSYEGRLIYHPRPDSDIPPPAKMWAPLAPGVVREILPTELRYSPFIDGDGKMGGDDVAMALAASGIVDIMGVGEALAYAVEHPEGDSARDSGIGTSENAHVLLPGSTKATPVEVDEDGNLTAKLSSAAPSRMPVQYDVMRPNHNQHYRLQRAQKSPDTAHTYKSSALEHHTTPTREYVMNTSEVGLVSSPMISSEGSSHQNSPRPLGSPNDLVGFQDLFYKPGTSPSKDLRREHSFGEQSSNGSQTRLSNIPFDLKSPHHQKPASGLTTLARKLSEEYEQLSITGRSNSQYSQSSAGVSGSSRQPNTRRPTEGSLEFVFEGMTHPDSPTQGIYVNESPRLLFEPGENIPEDVESTSSLGHQGVIDEDDEDGNTTEIFHVKQVESGTPAAVDTDRRLSFVGQLGYQTERHEVSAPHSIAATSKGNETDPLSAVSSSKSEARILSGLQPPLTDGTRSSYITTSTMSRMSGLSDFPVPPRDVIVDHRTSLLSTFFAEANDRPPMPIRTETSQSSSLAQATDPNQLAFGAGADAEDIVRALSNQPVPF